MHDLFGILKKKIHTAQFAVYNSFPNVVIFRGVFVPAGLGRVKATQSRIIEELRHLRSLQWTSFFTAMADHGAVNSSPEVSLRLTSGGLLRPATQ